MRPSRSSASARQPRKAAGLALGLLLAGAPPTAAEEAPGSLLEALGDGEPVLDLRLRYEDVADDAVGEKHARATTLRTVLGYESAAWRGWSLYAEAENVAALGNDLYDDRGAGGLGNGVTDRPVVADPAGTELNQALLRYRGAGWKLAVGRQEIVLGDSRFVGNVGWRQNHQSFDAVRLDVSALSRIDLTYGYLDRAHRIFGDSQELAAHLLDAGIDLGRGGTLTLYGYLLDYRRPEDAGLSTSTLGAEWSGRRALGDRVAMLWELEYAAQSDYEENPQSVDAGYSFAMLGAELGAVTLRLGREVLEGSAEDGRFRTPLATLHKFNGWADKFLVTPPAGLEDLHLQADGTAGPLAWLVRYHDFDAESTDASYGAELDLQLLWKAPRGVQLGLKGALYDADRFAADTDKWMLWASWGL